MAHVLKDAKINYCYISIRSNDQEYVVHYFRYKK